jgi:hypothetical protein
MAVMAHHDLVASMILPPVLFGRLLPVLCNSASALETSSLLWSIPRCHLREIEIRGDVKAQHLMISVMASERDHTFGPDPSASCLVMIQ